MYRLLFFIYLFFIYFLFSFRLSSVIETLSV